MMICPLPGRRRTRAMACLRRPVVWMSGLDTCTSRSYASSDPRLGVGDLEDLRLLGGVRVLGAGVDLQLAQLLAAERTLREHPPHRLANGIRGLPGEEVRVGLTS